MDVVRIFKNVDIKDMRGARDYLDCIIKEKETAHCHLCDKKTDSWDSKYNTISFYKREDESIPYVERPTIDIDFKTCIHCRGNIQRFLNNESKYTWVYRPVGEVSE